MDNINSEFYLAQEIKHWNLLRLYSLCLSFRKRNMQDCEGRSNLTLHYYFFHLGENHKFKKISYFFKIKTKKLNLSVGMWWESTFFLSDILVAYLFYK